jgi:hypothetical protein
MNHTTANLIYDILVKECGAFEEEREHFIIHQTTTEIREWRFCGKLGFGGKFWNADDRLYVNCYNEDLTPERSKMIEQANKLLEKI